MAEGIEERVAKTFQSVYRSNPLHKLNVSDRTFLWSLLFLYSYETCKSGGRADALFEEWERKSQTVADAAKLGERLKSEIFGGPSAGALRGFTVGFEDLPKRLADFSRRLGRALDAMGKRGRKREVLTIQRLVEASEFVKLKTRYYNDEHSNPSPSAKRYKMFIFCYLSRRGVPSGRRIPRSICRRRL
jgi:hypothetical protein